MTTSARSRLGFGLGFGLGFRVRVQGQPTKYAHTGSNVLGLGFGLGFRVCV